MALVPISRRALSWAVAESGIPKTSLDTLLRVPIGTVESWIEGDDQPNQSQFKRLKERLRRPAAIFFMETPPATAESAVAMRFGFGATGRARTPKERLVIRDSLRVRDFVSDLRDELGRRQMNVPTYSTNESPERVASAVRQEFFGISVEDQMSWKTPTEAFRKWRSLIERMDILVFLYPIGEDSARGFSFATQPPPVIGVSSTWDATVRVYTLFHELGHILTRTNSSCVEDLVKGVSIDPIERWCENFAASFLMPRPEIEKLTSQNQATDPIASATRIANKLFVSRKSALLRLVEIGHANWDDFRRLQSKYEKKKSGGRPDSSQKRSRDVARRDTYGGCLSIVDDAYKAGFVSESDIRTYLRMYPNELN